MTATTDRYAALVRAAERERAASTTYVIEGRQGTIWPVRRSQRECFVRAWERLGYDDVLGRGEKETFWQTWRKAGRR